MRSISKLNTSGADASEEPESLFRYEHPFPVRRWQLLPTPIQTQQLYPRGTQLVTRESATKQVSIGKSASVQECHRSFPGTMTTGKSVHRAQLKKHLADLYLETPQHAAR